MLAFLALELDKAESPDIGGLPRWKGANELIESKRLKAHQTNFLFGAYSILRTVPEG